MKIEVGESLGYSYLRHVKECWLVQANWKVSESWPKHSPNTNPDTNTELENLFREMQDEFDSDGKVFKKTKDVHQLVKQAEIDIVGVDFSGGVHALEIAFHERGLRYGADPDKRILKKLLRTYLILRAYHGPHRKLHISFLSPKVNPGVAKPLTTVFNRLRQRYPEVTWSLLINGEFRDKVLQATLDAAETTADSSELFVRATRLRDIVGEAESSRNLVSGRQNDSNVQTNKPAGQSDFRQPQGPDSGLNAILGQWPGDETDDEIAVELENLS
jgi:hypothetical protein